MSDHDRLVDAKDSIDAAIDALDELDEQSTATSVAALLLTVSGIALDARLSTEES